MNKDSKGKANKFVVKLALSPNGGESSGSGIDRHESDFCAKEFN